MVFHLQSALGQCSLLDQSNRHEFFQSVAASVALDLGMGDNCELVIAWMVSDVQQHIQGARSRYHFSDVVHIPITDSVNMSYRYRLHKG